MSSLTCPASSKWLLNQCPQNFFNQPQSQLTSPARQFTMSVAPLPGCISWYWAAWFIPWLLNDMTLKGVVASFLFPARWWLLVCRLLSVPWAPGASDGLLRELWLRLPRAQRHCGLLAGGHVQEGPKGVNTLQRVSLLSVCCCLLHMLLDRARRLCDAMSVV